MVTKKNTPTNHNEKPSLTIGLNAVVAAIEGDKPLVLCTRPNTSLWALPYGPFDPIKHRTFEIGLRDFVQEQTHMQLRYVEQLYTFGDAGRELPSAMLQGHLSTDRIVSVGYLALTKNAAPIALENTAWRNWYDHFPWEDWRNGTPSILLKTILPQLQEWILTPSDTALRQNRLSRIKLAFGFEGTGWEEERTLDRYELLFEAGVVQEATPPNASDSDTRGASDSPMISDHRRILATAIGRLRGKLRYRPIIFEMMPAVFTLLDLQRSVEAIIGFPLHKQNFRRGIDNSGLVKKTGNMSDKTGGRPAATFCFDKTNMSTKIAHDQTIKGLTLPRLRQRPDFKLST